MLPRVSLISAFSLARLHAMALLLYHAVCRQRFTQFSAPLPPPPRRFCRAMMPMFTFAADAAAAAPPV